MPGTDVFVLDFVLYPRACLLALLGFALLALLRFSPFRLAGYLRPCTLSITGRISRWDERGVFYGRFGKLHGMLDLVAAGQGITSLLQH